MSSKWRFEGERLSILEKRTALDDMAKKRVDFLAFGRSEDELIIIEMKRPGHPVEFEEIQRLDQESKDFEILTLAEMFSRAKRFY